MIKSVNEVLTMTAEANNPSRAGSRACKPGHFGEFNRYLIYAIHTRGEAVSWIVCDLEGDYNPQTGHTIIRQAPTVAQAIEGLIA